MAHECARMATGQLRVVAVAAPKRLGGPLANVPTWKEQGVDLVWSGWRAIIGRKGLSASQIAYWEVVLRKASEENVVRGQRSVTT